MNPVQPAQVATHGQGAEAPRSVLHDGRSYIIKTYATISLRLHKIFEKFVFKTQSLGMNMSIIAGSILLLSWSVFLFSAGFLTGLLFTEWTLDKIEILNAVTKRMFVQMEVYKIFFIAIVAAATYEFTLSMGAFVVGSYFGTLVWDNTEQKIPEPQTVRYCSFPSLRNSMVAPQAVYALNYENSEIQLPTLNTI
jgi:hypothetical protein